MTSADRALLTELLRLLKGLDDELERGHMAGDESEETLDAALKAIPALHRLLAQEGEGMVRVSVLEALALRWATVRDPTIDCIEELRSLIDTHDITHSHLNCPCCGHPNKCDYHASRLAAAPDAEGET